MINVIDYYPKGDFSKMPLRFGFLIDRKYNIDWVTLFALSDNFGPKLSRNLYGVASIIGEDFLDGKPIDRVCWTFVAGLYSSMVRFSLADGALYKIDVSNFKAMERELREPELLWSPERYEGAYKGTPPTLISRNTAIKIIPAPKTAFAIPSPHPGLEDGLFYCLPHFYGIRPPRVPRPAFMLADTGKLAAFQEAHPKRNGALIESVRHYFNLSAKRTEISSDLAVGANSFEFPNYSSYYELSLEKGLVLHNETAETDRFLNLAQRFGLACIPVAIHDRTGDDWMLPRLAEAIGYGHKKDGFKIVSPDTQPFFCPVAA